MAVYVLRADYGKYTEAFKQNNYCGIGWLPEAVLNKKLSRNEIADLYRITYPEDSKMRVAVNVGQIARFVLEISVGDYVVTPYEGGFPSF